MKATKLMSTNPYRPGAGQEPPYLAGRTYEQTEFLRLLDQEIIMENLIITGLRGIGKTALLESLKPVAISHDWLWAGEDFSQSLGISEERLVMRILADISFLTSSIIVDEKIAVGFTGGTEKVYLSYELLRHIYTSTPGLASDKLKHVLEVVWSIVPSLGKRGIIFAYDEAQTLTDNKSDSQYPLSLLLDVFQALQRKGVRFMLVLTGLPTLQPNLVATRTYTERLFHVFMLKQLSSQDSHDAIIKPLLNDDGTPNKNMIQFDETSINTIAKASGGYPYFIQYICRETYDVFQQQATSGKSPGVPLSAIMEKLDNNFFYGRWAKTTEREKELMIIIAQAKLAEFTPTQVVRLSEQSQFKKFSIAQLTSYLKGLIDEGLIYKDKRGSYSFAVPLLGGYIMRTYNEKLDAEVR